MRPLTISLSLLTLLLASCAHEKNRWRDVTDAAQGATHIYGTVNAGCIAGARNLRDPHVPIEFMRPSRRRYYGHPSMAAFLSSFSAAYHGARGNQLLVGDVAQPRGGPTGIPGALASHSSHQTGLDVDIWYDSARHPLTENERESRQPLVLVAQDGDTMSTHWDAARYERILRLASEHAEVERIFVNPAIKRELCMRVPLRGKDQGLWLRKIRPWWAHDDHFHVRLVCPAGEPDCRTVGDSIPAGNGCDDTLNWWFSTEAKSMVAERQSEPGTFKMPDMPEACGGLLPPKP